MQRVHAARALKADHVHCGAWQLAGEGEVWLLKSCRSSHWLSPSFFHLLCAVWGECWGGGGVGGEEECVESGFVGVVRL